MGVVRSPSAHGIGNAGVDIDVAADWTCNPIEGGGVGVLLDNTTAVMVPVESVLSELRAG